MARIARVVLPGMPHHVTQRGNRQRTIFAQPADYEIYRALLAKRCRDLDVQVWAYCLMPNHVHLIMVPSTLDSLARVIGESHRQFTSFINAREGVSGHLFQGRFASVPMDEAHCHAAGRYIAQNPVKAGLVERPQDWRWSSTAAHLDGRNDVLVSVAPLLERVGSVRGYFGAPPCKDFEQALKRGLSTGRPLMSEGAVEDVERLLGRRIRKRRPGPRPAQCGHAAERGAG